MKLALRTSTALIKGQPIIAPPGMKRLAQTMSQPSRAKATMRSSTGALMWSSAGNIRMKGAVLLAKPVMIAPWTPWEALCTSSTGSPVKASLLERIAGGWEITGYARVTSGRPFTAYAGTNTVSNVNQSTANCTGCKRGRRR